MVGLSTAWFLQERGVEVTVVDRTGVAAGASWGNAGWVTPSFAVPLPEPAMLRTGLRSLLSPASPLYIPPRADPRLVQFLLTLARNCTHRRWQVAMSALAPLNHRALAAFDALGEGGVREPTTRSDQFILAAESRAQLQGVVAELEQVRAAGQKVDYRFVDGPEVQELEPALSSRIGSAVVLGSQRYINPGDFVVSLADSVRVRGGKILEGVLVRAVHDDGSGVRVETTAGSLAGDVTVLAAGAWLGRLARGFGVRMPVQAGRGYSFTVTGGVLPSGPTYFPGRRAVCTPLGEGRVRISGMMEFAAPDQPLDARRIAAIIAQASPMLRDIDWDGRTDEWVGPRPCTTDGLPLIGPTRSPRVFVNGGHSMWGVTLGPISGQLLAEAVTGRAPAELPALHPLR